MPTKITRLLKTLMDVISDLRISAIFGQKIFGAKDQEPRAIHQKAITKRSHHVRREKREGKIW
jgi:hypothetical protein